MGKFGEQVNRYAKKYEGRMRAIARTAVLDTVSMAQRTRGNGGRMPVDTGFLRASIQAAIGTMPSGPTRNDGEEKYSGDTQAAGEPVVVTLLRWNPNTGSPLFVGWTANYARKQQAKNGFMRGAVEKWDQTVTKAVKKVETSYV